MGHHGSRNMNHFHHSLEGGAQPPEADWAAWLPGTCQVGRLDRRQGGPPR